MQRTCRPACSMASRLMPPHPNSGRSWEKRRSGEGWGAFRGPESSKSRLRRAVQRQSTQAVKCGFWRADRAAPRPPHAPPHQKHLHGAVPQHRLGLRHFVPRDPLLARRRGARPKADSADGEGRLVALSIVPGPLRGPLIPLKIRQQQRRCLLSCIYPTTIMSHPSHSPSLRLLAHTKQPNQQRVLCCYPASPTTFVSRPRPQPAAAPPNPQNTTQHNKTKQTHLKVGVVPEPNSLQLAEPLGPPKVLKAAPAGGVPSLRGGLAHAPDPGGFGGVAALVFVCCGLWFRRGLVQTDEYTT
jgi:hypothetical protein